MKGFLVSNLIECELLVSEMNFLSDLIYQLTIHRIENGFSDHDNVLQDYSYFQGFFYGVVSTQGNKRDKKVKIYLNDIRLYQLCELLKFFLLLKNVEGIENKELAENKARNILNNLSSEYATFLV